MTRIRPQGTASVHLAAAAKSPQFIQDHRSFSADKSKNSLKPVKKVTTFKLLEHVLRASGLGDFFHQRLELRGFVDREIGENLAV